MSSCIVFIFSSNAEWLFNLLVLSGVWKQAKSNCINIITGSFCYALFFVFFLIFCFLFSVTCTALTSLENGSVTLETNGTLTAAKFNCKIGFTLEGVRKTLCDRSGLWEDQQPTCGMSEICLCTCVFSFLFVF